MIRFGIAGFGLHAVRRLMPGFALAQNCRVVALSRRDPQKAREAAAPYGIPNVFGSTEELCRCPEVDAVLVTTPNACHRADVLTAVTLGKPVLCEKPMGMNAEECREMVESARKAGVLLGMAQIFRFEESTRRLRERIAAGEIGKPLFARAEFGNSYAGVPARNSGHGARFNARAISHTPGICWRGWRPSSGRRPHGGSADHTGVVARATSGCYRNCFEPPRLRAPGR